MHFLGVAINLGASWLMLASSFICCWGNGTGIQGRAGECPLLFSLVDIFIDTVSFFVYSYGGGGSISTNNNQHSDLRTVNPAF